LGAAVEFDDLATIRRRFGPTGIQDPATAFGRVGAITDDTQMTLFTAEGLLQADDRLDYGIGYPPARMLDAYHRWLFTQGVAPRFDGQPSWHGELHRLPAMRSRRAPGSTCLSALQGQPRDWEKRGAVSNDSKGCGGVMRAAPCGLVRGWGVGPFEIGVMAAALTHGHPSGSQAAGALAVIISHLTDRDSPFRHPVSAVVEAIDSADGEVHDALRAALDASRSGAPPSPDVVEQLGAGWVAEEALAIAVYCALIHHDDFAAAVRLAANHSGDSDSTAAMTGNLVGAWLGVQAIPEAWLAKLELRDEIDRLATAMQDRYAWQSVTWTCASRGRCTPSWPRCAAPWTPTRPCTALPRRRRLPPRDSRHPRRTRRRARA
jgi:ADP-ribosylglycohydrolase